MGHLKIKIWPKFYSKKSGLKFGLNFIVKFQAIFDLATLTRDSDLGSNDLTQELSGGVILLCARDRGIRFGERVQKQYRNGSFHS